MDINKPQDPDKMTEFEKKHTPTIEISNDKVIVKVGDGISHPMEEAHYIVHIELFKGDESMEKKELKPGDKPEADFGNVPLGYFRAQALCNLHGLWESIF